jgi:hypothetical protein
LIFRDFDEGIELKLISEVKLVQSFEDPINSAPEVVKQ